MRVLAAALLLATASAIPTHHQTRASAFERDVGPVDPSVPAAVATGCKAHVNQTDCSADSCCNWWVRAQPDGAGLARVQIYYGAVVLSCPCHYGSPCRPLLLCSPAATNSQKRGRGHAIAPIVVDDLMTPSVHVSTRLQRMCACVQVRTQGDPGAGGLVHAGAARGDGPCLR